MARRSSKHPTELELEILRLLWRDGPSTVRHIRKELGPFRKLAYTSVMTTMVIMTRKGYLNRCGKEGRSHVYEPVIQEEETVQAMLADLVRRLFHGSILAAAVRLLESGQLSETEWGELRRFIRQKERERPS